MGISITRTGAGALLAGALVISPLAAQEDLASLLAARQQSVPRGKHTFEETWLLPEGGATAPTAEATRFAGRVAVYQDGPRERLEIRRAAEGRLGEPIVIVSDGRKYHLVTRVGATEITASAPAGDPFVRLVLAGPPGEAPTHRVVSAPGGGVAAVVLRSPGMPAFDSGKAFELELPQVGGGLLKSGLLSFQSGRDTQVTPAAGARGVNQIRTAGGTISVTPDPEAVRWMESQEVSAVEFESFKREERLKPYHALPESPEDSPEAAS